MCIGQSNQPEAVVWHSCKHYGPSISYCTARKQCAQKFCSGPLQRACMHACRAARGCRAPRSVSCIACKLCASVERSHVVASSVPAKVQWALAASSGQGSCCVACKQGVCKSRTMMPTMCFTILLNLRIEDAVKLCAKERNQRPVLRSHDIGVIGLNLPVRRAAHETQSHSGSNDVARHSLAAFFRWAGGIYRS